MDLKEMVVIIWSGLLWPGQGQVVNCFEHNDETLCFVQCGAFLE